MWQDLHRYWFGDALDSAQAIDGRMAVWFSKDSEVDRTIRERFAPWLEDASSGRLESWTKTPKGYVSFIVLLDQVPRNSYRGDRKSFAWDSAALELCKRGIGRIDPSLGVFEKLFYFLPLQHSEVLADQEESVRHYEGIAHEAASSPLGGFCRENARYAVAHRDIIARFGRFPHRNAVLGRPSTDEEAAFLLQPGSSF